MRTEERGSVNILLRLG